MHASYRVSDATFDSFLVTATGLSESETFEKKLFFQWNFKIFHFCVKKINMIKYFDFLKSAQKPFTSVLSKFLCQ